MRSAEDWFEILNPDYPDEAGNAHVIIQDYATVQRDALELALKVLSIELRKQNKTRDDNMPDGAWHMYSYAGTVVDNCIKKIESIMVLAGIREDAEA